MSSSSQKEAQQQALFLAHCGANGLNPLDEGSRQVKELDDELAELESKRQKIRFRRNTIARWLKTNGASTTQVQRYQPDDIDIPLEDDNQDNATQRRLIISAIAESGHQGMSIINLFQKLNIPRDEKPDVIRQVTLLCEKGVLSRTPEEAIVSGRNWENRHQVVS